MKHHLLLTLMLCLLLTTCSNENKHFLTDADYRQQVYAQFLKRQQAAANRQEALFSVLEQEDLSVSQKEALEFLYAYMPLSDLSEYNGAFFLQQVDAALEARRYFHWGKTVPEDIFRHFVLVYRVNNEYLDTARSVFFNELKARVQHLSMADAALEVNHWCHEKVTYRGTDGRTSAPLALVRTAWGRCGEESTFTVTALRAVGIPARQCYTPRWVHTNDNHAWVEVWVDGKWYYMGACEPEAELNTAWFSAPAKRTMMVHTNVFGLYKGTEEKNVETPLYSTINLLANYAPTRPVRVQIVDKQYRPVADATVKFKVYNYAEFYPIATATSDSKGMASILSGRGDLMIWAHKGDRYGYAHATPESGTIIITLDRINNPVYPTTDTYSLNVPPEQSIQALPKEKNAANAVRLAHEDAIRNAYMSTFANEEYAAQLASETGLNTAEVWKYLQLAQGNWQEIALFLRTEKDNADLFPFMASLLPKDLRDTPAAYLSNHLANGRSITANIPYNIYVNKVLSPRIALELIKPWRTFFQQEPVAETIAGKTPNVQNIIDYTRTNILINDDENYYNCYQTPQGVYELKIADRRSRNVFFVAACRSMGIPAQVEEATGKTQYYENGRWNDVVFDDTATTAAQAKASLTLTNDPANIIKPGYYLHYTLAFFKDGDFHTLDFENNPALNTFPCTLELDEGYYQLMVGSRANDGSVTVHTTQFQLSNDQPVTLSIKLPEVTGKLFVKGIVDMNTVITLNNGNKKSLKELDNGKGLMLCFVDAGKEPSKHILQDLPAQQQELEAWSGGMVFMTPGDQSNHAFDASAFKGLPAQTVWGVDHNRALLKATAEALQLDFSDEFPLTVYLSTNGGILYSSAGYRIGVGEDIIKTIQQEIISKQRNE